MHVKIIDEETAVTLAFWSYPFIPRPGDVVLVNGVYRTATAVTFRIDGGTTNVDSRVVIVACKRLPSVTDDDGERS